MRVCLDTNVLVAALATRGLYSDLLRVVLSEHELVIGEHILVELEHTLSRTFRLPDDRLAAVRALFTFVEMVPNPLEPSAVEVRDPTDRWILAIAENGRADLLVSGDRDLLAVAHASSVPIITPRTAWERLRGQSGR